MASLTIFANFFINDQERFFRMQDSFLSFKNIDAKLWVVNVRGKYNLETLFFLHDQLGDRLSGHIIESGLGWFADSRKLLSVIDTDYVLFWLEDHFNLVDVSKYKAILEEMKASGSESLCYSFWEHGRFERIYAGIKKVKYENIEVFLLDKKANDLIQKNHPNYIINCISIFSVELFKRIVNKNDPVLRQWPKETPFDFEKKGTDIHWLPIMQAVPRYELFTSIDDDRGCVGYSLQSRSIYPRRVIREEKISDMQHLGIMRKLGRKILPGSLKYFLKRLSYHL